MKISTYILQEANGCLRPALLRQARRRPTKGIAVKTIVCGVNNGESQTHFMSAYTGIEGGGRSGPGCRTVFEELPARDY